MIQHDEFDKMIEEMCDISWVKALAPGVIVLLVLLAITVML